MELSLSQFLMAPPKDEDPKRQLAELLREIRHDLVHERTTLNEKEQRVLIAIVVAEVEVGRAESVLQRVQHALEMARSNAQLAHKANEGLKLFTRILGE